MKKCLMLILALGLLACGSGEMKQELSKLRVERDALKGENQQLLEENKESAKALADLKAAGTDDQTMVRELTQLRSQAEELVELQAKFKDCEARVAKFEAPGDGTRQLQERIDFLKKQMQGVKATITTSLGVIKVGFFPDLAPIHCFNFITRAESGYFNKTQFHRVIPGFMIQGGDGNSRDLNFGDDGQGGTVVSIPHEFHGKNHDRGILSMARRGDPRFGAGSQFFIMHANSPNLNNQYTVFGEVISGMDVVDKIATTNKDRRDHPVNPVWIESITVAKEP